VTDGQTDGIAVASTALAKRRAVKSHCEHGKPGTPTRWRHCGKNDLNHSHYNFGTDF